MSQNPDCPANRSRKTSLPLPKPRPQYGDGRGQPPYAHICSGWKDKKARWETKWGHRSFFPTLILCPASPRIRGRCSSSQRFLSVWTAIRILFFLNMQRVGPCYNPPAQEAENTLVQRAESFFYYIRGFIGLTYSEWEKIISTSISFSSTDAHRQIAHNKNDSLF